MAAGEVVRQSLQWAPGLGLEITFRLDGFAWLFAMLVTVMGALVALYARYYMSPQDPVPGFFLSSSLSWAPCSAWSCQAT